MKLLDLEQGSEAWLSWRKTVITATECSIIMGSNPWSTPYKLWQRKLGYVEEQKTNDAMERGKRLEPEAREKFIREEGIFMEPVVVESSEYQFLGASLDGMSPCGKFILEIKCGGAQLHEKAKQGLIPDYYMHQMQHQLLVTGASKCYYYSYDGQHGIRIDVYPDSDFKEKFLPKAREFYKCIAMTEAPPLQQGDYHDMAGDRDWQDVATEYAQVCDQIKELEDVKENYRKKLIELARDQNCSGCGIKVMKTVTKGRIAYDDIPEIKNLDLEQYRKKPTTAWRIVFG